MRHGCDTMTIHGVEYHIIPKPKAVRFVWERDRGVCRALCVSALRLGLLMSGRGGTGPRARERVSRCTRRMARLLGLAPSNLRALGFARRVAPRPRPRRARCLA